MDKIFTKSLFILLLFYLSTITQVFAQAVILKNVDAGPYGQGSTISATFKIASSPACLSGNNVFTLYLSDATGSFAKPKIIGTFTGFYGSFVNGIIPQGTPAGIGYRLMIGTSSPATFSVASAPFIISPLPGVTAGTASQVVNTANPEVFGACIGIENSNYTFNNQSSAGAAANANFFNESAQSDEGTLPLLGNTNFLAKAVSYTVNVTAVAGGIVGTKAYLLMNNVVNNSFGATGSTTICLNGQNTLTYNVDVTSANGIQNNFPGMLYNVNWGDGTSSSLSLCAIVADGGQISHKYTKSSCGNLVNGQANVFEVDLQPVSPYCGKVVTQVTGYAKVLAPPQNKFEFPVAACVNQAVIFVNNSIAGQDPNSTSLNCVNINGLYTWLVDGVVVASNYIITQSLVHTFTTTGQHTVTLRLQNNNGLCIAPDLTEVICVQSPPKPSFTLPVNTTCSANFITPQNTSVIDNNCDNTNTYSWVVTGPAPVFYTGGTNAGSAQPNFLFNTAGIYDIKLKINTLSCGQDSSAVQTITVNSSPIAILSPDVNLCGNNATLNFNANPGVTRTTLSGTQTQQSTTYTWAVTGGTYAFTGGTTANSMYPQILFNDYSTYTVTVTHVNNCGSVTSSQKLTFQQSPTVSAGTDQIICEGTQATLAANITGAVNSFQWVGGTGIFAPNRTTLNAVYTPSAAEITAGLAIITLRVQTAVAAPCDVINDDVTINITQKDKITSVAAQSVCNLQQFTYTVTSANPLSTYNWVTNLTSGNATGFGATGSGNTINDIISNNSATVDAVVTYTITPTTNGCPGIPFALTLTVKALPAATAIAATPQICSNQTTGITFTSNISGTTFLWTSTASPGITGNTNPTTAVTAGNIGDLLVNTGATDGTVTYNIIPYSGTCAGVQATVVITVKPLPITSIPGPNEEICNTPTYNLKGNNPAQGTGKWTVISSQSGITFSDDTNPNAVVSGLLPGNIYKFKWTITAATTCPPSSNIVAITVNKETVGGTTAGNATVCADSNRGKITLTGKIGNVLRWEASTDNGATWALVNNTTDSLIYTGLTQTTQYHAVIQNGSCSVKISSATAILVNTPVITANAGVDLLLCNAATVTLNANNAAPFTGAWTQTFGPPVTFVNPADPKTKITGLTGGNIYKFVWTIKGSPPCADSKDEVEVNNAADVIANFTANKSTGCGPLTVNFTNNSSLIAGTNFIWNFSDGSPTSNLANPQHTFQPSADGKDVVYTVSLTVPDNCIVRPPVIFNITVSPATPTAAIFPDRLSGCGTFVLNVANVSPGKNALYEFYLYDNATLVQKITKTDTTSVQFNPVSTPITKIYTLYMEATNFCGIKARSTEIPVTISPANFAPQMFLKNNLNKGCAPFATSFVNNSSGGNTFKYNIYDAKNVLVESVVAGKSDLPYIFTTPGIYFVTITAANDCAIIESTPKLRVDVFTTPVPDFDADVKTGCRQISVNFANLTPLDGTTPPSSLSYDWDFGDGSQHSFNFNPATHVYDFKKSPYTITLKVTNLATGCTNTVVKTNFINVTSPPVTEFTVKPGFITTIPNYSFSFNDQTTGGSPTIWQWDFGDGNSSSSRNPSHAYADTGIYKVVLRVTGSQGCDSVITHSVQITGVPGQLYLPNAFMPGGSTSALQTFLAKGSGIASWRLQIFNNWGQLLWETNKLSSTGEPVESWDGSYKGAPMPQGAYIWQATAKFINGTDWKGMQYNNSLPKRTGAINLIR